MDVQEASAAEAVAESEAAATAGEAESVEGKAAEAAAADVGGSNTGFYCRRWICSTIFFCKLGRCLFANHALTGPGVCC